MDISTNPWLDRIIEAALDEDLAHGDLTTRITVRASVQAVGRVIAGEELVVAGAGVFERVFNRVDSYVSVNVKVPDGTKVRAGEEIVAVAGRAASILAAERVALNFLMHMCGVATLTRRYVKRIPEGSRTRIVDTRKTLPGLRALEKYAVRCGGGVNHRSDLGGGILNKDNHIAAAGSVARAVASARASLDPSHRIEVEVSTIEQVDEAIASGAEAILLDNMTAEKVALAVQRISGRALVEASGRVGIDDVPTLAVSGLDFISVGALTHSAPAADMSLEIEVREED
jgi:nicotinate-nucleotide pyrophosphorylase (carboxylating)